MRLQHRQLDHVAGLLDFVGDERRPELFHQLRPVHVPGNRELVRRIAFDHLAADMLRAIRRAGDEGAADFQVGLDRKAGKILPAELGRGQRRPYLFRRGGDVDRVDDRGLEILDVHDAPSMPSAETGISNAVPDSSRLLRLDIMAGHPLEMPSNSLLPSAKPSCESVSFTNLPCCSILNTTFEAFSLRYA